MTFYFKFVSAFVFTFTTIVTHISSFESVGCLFSDDLCENGEICVDDNAFGRCMDLNVGHEPSPGDFQSLNAETLRILENEMRRLFLSGYRWDHQYTQCVVKQILYTHKLGISYDPGLCSRLLKLTAPEISPETAIEKSFSPEDLAFIEFTPETDSNFANEIFLPLKDQNKYQYKLKSGVETSHKRGSINSNINRDEYKFLEKLAAEAERLLKESDDDKYDRFPEKNLPVIDTELSSDLNQKPVYSEGGVHWVPIEKADSKGSKTPDETTKSISDVKSQATDGGSDTDHEKPILLQSNGLFEYVKPIDNDLESKVLQQMIDTANINGDDDDEDEDGDDYLVNDRSFPRQHRIDTKKPGPGYYIHEADSNDADILQPQLLIEDDGQSNKPLGLDKYGPSKANIQQKQSGNEQLIHGGPSFMWSNDDNKRDNIRAYTPVSEGPLKIEANLKDTIIVRPVNEGEHSNLEAVDSSHAYVKVNKVFGNGEAHKFVELIQQLLRLPKGTFSNVRMNNAHVTFKVNPNQRGLNASVIASKIEDMSDQIKSQSGLVVEESGIGDKAKLEVVSSEVTQQYDHKLAILTVSLCAVILAALVSGALLFLVKRNAKIREKIYGITGGLPDAEAAQDYQDLCRQRMQSKSNEIAEPIQVAANAGTGVQTNKVIGKIPQQSSEGQQSTSSRSSTSSWNEEPVASNMDISTGHMILSYMEDHLKNKDRLDREWEALCAYEADPCSTNAAHLPQNAKKNRYADVLPYDHSRVILNDLANITGSDYANASTITDHDPRNPAYIATQGPLSNTAADFWQMIWEQGSVIIVMLTRLMENGMAMCHRYWPEEGSEVYHNYEVHLVSEHIWCDDYLVRSFYIKNLKTSETRTVTQFHFLSWPENGIPPNAKSILEFRRKVNKSFRGRSCPIVVHCSDGTSRSGTYILIDMVLNRLSKGTKEIDIAATLEHIRDQRMKMVKTKGQFEYVLTAIAEEVHAILKTLGHN